MPAYYLYIGLLTLLIVFGDYAVNASGGWSSRGYFASLWFYFNNFLPRGGFWQLDWLSIHIWSLALEEQFYLVWPALFLLAIRMRRSVLISLVIVAALLISRPFVSYFALMYLPQGRALAIVAGCTMALWIRDRNQKGSLPSWLVSPQIRLILVATTLGLIVLLMVVHQMMLIGDEQIETERISRWVLPVFALQFSMIVAMLWYGQEDWLSRLLSWSPLVYIGKISYGIYLYHMLAHHLTWEILLKNIDGWPSYPKMGLRLIVYAILSVGIAALSYHFYEKPFLRLKQTLR